MSLGVFTLYPLSRGSIHVTSAVDVYAHPDFNAGALSHPADIAPLIWAYKKIREISRRMVSFRGELAETHPPYPAGSAAACIDAYDPNVKDIVYSEEDEKILEQYIRQSVATTFHSMF